MINSLKKSLFFISLLCLGYTNAVAQVTSAELKAAMILRFCENVQWQNELPETINIGCLNNTDLYNFLKPAEQNIKIQKRNLRIQKLNNISDIHDFHVIYYGGEKSNELMELFNHAKNNNTLLITDNSIDELFVLINFIDKADKVEFKVNMPNLTLAGFEVKHNLLLNGGSVVDINEAYKKFEERIQNSKKKLDEYEKALLISQNQIKQKDSSISEKEQQLNEYLKDIDTLQVQSIELQNKLVNERKQLETHQKELQSQHIELNKSNEVLESLQNSIKLKEEEYDTIKSNLQKLETEASDLKSEISEKDFTLTEKEMLISSQQRILVLIFALVIALIIVGISLYRLFILKKKHNTVLVQRVEERTKELKLSNMQYQSLFNLAPVALWETDFSEVKKYMNSLKTNSNDTIEDLVSQNKDFSIECVRRIDFKNMNESSLDLFKVKNQVELVDIYEKLHTAGELIELAPELKLIYNNKTSNTFESVRRNKHGEKIELIVTWIDISKTPGTFKRVLLSLVDITHLRKVEKELKKHQNELELLVREKTDDLEAANEELKSSNEELFEKSEIINNQNSELKVTLQHLQETQAQLLQSEKMASLGILTAGVAHEINNPLNYISGAYHGFKNMLGDSTDEKTALLLDALETGVERVSNIVKSLSQFSRSNTATDEECDIHEIITNCLVMLQNTLKHRIEIKKAFASEPAIIRGNVGALHQVFLNILSNAEQAMEDSGEIEIKTSINQTNVTIEITDTGYGIAEENINKITDPFYTTKDPGKGTGLGLSITYNIINEHDGNLNFISEVNKGTTAIILLPKK